MNVAIFASAFHPHTGGVEELCRQLAIEYQRRGMGVAVFTNRWPRGLPAYEKFDGIDVHRLAMRVPDGSLKARVTYTLTSASVRRQMLGLLRELKADVLHVQCVSCNAAYALQAKWKLGLPLVVTLQGELTMDASQLFQRADWAKRVLKESLDAADAITGCSHQTLMEAEQWYGKPFGPRGSVVYNGVSLSDAQAAEPHIHPRPYILAIGRHVRQKGFDLLLRAMAELEKTGGVGHDLLLAGDGTENAALRQLTAELGLEQRVTFVGRVDHARASQLFAGCSFFVLPSRHEPFGIVNLEAMAAGKAIVAARVGGVPEIVKVGETGLLVPSDDVRALATSIRELALDPALRVRLGTCGKQRSMEFSWASIVDRYLQIYREITKAGKSIRAAG